MGAGLITLLVIGGIALLLIMWAIGMYNRLVRLRVDTDNGWSQIDVQLKRRHDLIPNLVETVKGYAGHEKGTLDAVISARNKAVSASTVSEHGVAEGQLTQALGRLFALSEAYPDLKANTNFHALQEELASTENKIGFARQHYNDVVARYETARAEFPGNVIAGAFNFSKRDYFEITDAAEKAVPKVSFS